MSIFGASRSYELAQDDTTKVITAVAGTQKDGVVNGLISEATGLFNGGMSGSVGMSHTLMAVGLPLAAAAFQKKRLTGAWGIPFTN